jgi:hypothetical protein
VVRGCQLDAQDCHSGAAQRNPKIQSAVFECEAMSCYDQCKKCVFDIFICDINSTTLDYGFRFAAPDDGGQSNLKDDEMSTFGNDLVQAMTEALAHAKGEGDAIVHALKTPREVREDAKPQSDADADKQAGK